MNTKKILALAFIAIAILSLVFAIVCFTIDDGGSRGSTESNKYYGGDAYTGIQNAAAQTASNVYYVNSNIQALTSCVKTVSGLAFALTALVFGALGFVKLQELKTVVAVAEPDIQTEETTNEEQV